MKRIGFILLVLWMGFIFYMSTDDGAITGRYNTGVVKVVKSQIGVDIRNATLKGISINAVLRKNTHFLLYAVLGVLVLNVVRHYNIKYKYLVSIMISSVYALTDEFHQAFMPTRTSSLFDVMIDTAGSLSAVCLIYIIKVFRDWRRILKNS